MKHLTEEEYKEKVKTNYGIVWDIKTDQDALDFMLKLKTLDCTPIHFYYVPYLNEDEAGIITCGHHVLQDGLTLMQAYHMVSDNPGKGEYPFFERKQPTTVQWI